MVAAIREAARRRDARVYLVGGFVRDLLLGRPIRDFDAVVEGDGAGLARLLAASLGGRLTEHARFATASIALPDGRTIDVAAARRETYRHPGALPDVVTGASLVEDLARRDFAVNAMAMEVTARRSLVDPFGGRADLARRRLRVLHGRSFLDDPTRALRGVRYETRLGFLLEGGTRAALRAALEEGAMDRVSGARVRTELERIFAEPAPPRSVARLRALGLAGAIAPALGAAADPVRRLGLVAALSASASFSPAPDWLCYLLSWMSGASATEHGQVADRLALAGAAAKSLRRWAATLARVGAGLAALAPSELVRRASGLSPNEIVAAASRLPARDRAALLAAGDPSKAPALSIGGADLLAAGVPAGRAIGAALARTRAAREDGRIGPEQELEFALRVARGDAS